MTDHKEKAEELLEASSNASTNEFGTFRAIQAQVHATLHLADVLAQKGADQ